MPSVGGDIWHASYQRRAPKARLGTAGYDDCKVLLSPRVCCCFSPAPFPPIGSPQCLPLVMPSLWPLHLSPPSLPLFLSFFLSACLLFFFSLSLSLSLALSQSVLACIACFALLLPHLGFVIKEKRISWFLRTCHMPACLETQSEPRRAHGWSGVATQLRELPSCDACGETDSLGRAISMSLTGRKICTHPLRLPQPLCKLSNNCVG